MLLLRLVVAGWRRLMVALEQLVLVVSGKERRGRHKSRHAFDSPLTTELSNSHILHQHTIPTPKHSFEPDIYFNDTYGLPYGTQPTVYQRAPQALNLAVNAWLRTFVGDGAAATLIGVQETPKAPSEIRLDFSSLLGPLFFTWVVQMLLPIFLMQLVYEKEHRLRMMMKMHGLGDGAYWLVTYTWFWALYVVYMAVFVAFGSAIGLKMFTKNSLGVQLILYFLFGHNMIAFAFLLSCFFSSSKTATVFAYLVVFGTGLIGSLLLARLIGSNLWYVTLLELVPSFALFRGLFEFGEYAFLAVYRDAYGMTFASLRDAGNGVAAAWGILAAEWWVFMALAWYLEQVFASGTGNRRHPLFFLDGLRRGGRAAAAARLHAEAQRAAAPEAMEQAPDVAAGAFLILPSIVCVCVWRGELLGLREACVVLCLRRSTKHTLTHTTTKNNTSTTLKQQSTSASSRSTTTTPTRSSCATSGRSTRGRTASRRSSRCASSTSASSAASASGCSAPTAPASRRRST